MAKLSFKPKTRQRKPTAAQQKVFDQLMTAIPVTIEKLETPAQAEQMESHIYRMRTGGMISDQTYQTWLNAIKQQYIKNEWAKPTT